MIWRVISIDIIVCAKKLIIDYIYILSMIYGMRNVKHRSLTHFLRCNTSLTIRGLKQVINYCDVSPELGALPPALRTCAGGDMSDVTARFHKIIAQLISDNRRVMMGYSTVMCCDWPAASELFGTPCVVECRNRLTHNGPQWYGAAATVARISFPEIGARYALKMFRRDEWTSAHGPWNEVPAAFAAFHAEPKDNNRVHMASLGTVKYMLSDWAGEEDEFGGDLRDNKYEMFWTDPGEMHRGNWRGGRRIDYGKTYRSCYGGASYNVRKLYRKIVNAADDRAMLAEIMNNPGTRFSAKDMEQAVRLVKNCGTQKLAGILEYIAAHSK